MRIDSVVIAAQHAIQRVVEQTDLVRLWVQDQRAVTGVDPRGRAHRNPIPYLGRHRPSGVGGNEPVRFDRVGKPGKQRRGIVEPVDESPANRR